MYIYKYIYTHTCTLIYTCIYIYIYIYTYAHIYTHAHHKFYHPKSSKIKASAIWLTSVAKLRSTGATAATTSPPAKI